MLLKRLDTRCVRSAPERKIFPEARNLGGNPLGLGNVLLHLWRAQLRPEDFRCVRCSLGNARGLRPSVGFFCLLVHAGHLQRPAADKVLGSHNAGLLSGLGYPISTSSRSVDEFLGQHGPGKAPKELAGILVTFRCQMLPLGCPNAAQTDSGSFLGECHEGFFGSGNHRSAGNNAHSCKIGDLAGHLSLQTRLAVLIFRDGHARINVEGGLSVLRGRLCGREH